MTRLYCAHTPDPRLTESCECGNAFRCTRYPEAAERMRVQSEQDRLRDRVLTDLLAMSRQDREGLRLVLQKVERVLASDRSAFRKGAKAK